MFPARELKHMIEYIRAYAHIRQDTYSIIYNNRMPLNSEENNEPR